MSTDNGDDPWLIAFAAELQRFFRSIEWLQESSLRFVNVRCYGDYLVLNLKSSTVTIAFCISRSGEELTFEKNHETISITSTSDVTSAKESFAAFVVQCTQQQPRAA